MPTQSLLLSVILEELCNDVKRPRFKRVVISGEVSDIRIHLLLKVLSIIMRLILGCLSHFTDSMNLDSRSWIEVIKPMSANQVAKSPPKPLVF